MPSVPYNVMLPPHFIKDFDIKKPLTLKVAIMLLEQHFSQSFYRLFLLVFPPQPNNPPLPGHKTTILFRCFPLRVSLGYYRSCDILLVCSTSFYRSANPKSHQDSLYPGCPVYLMTTHGQICLRHRVQV